MTSPNPEHGRHQARDAASAVRETFTPLNVKNDATVNSSFDNESRMIIDLCKFSSISYSPARPPSRSDQIVHARQQSIEQHAADARWWTS